MESHGICPIKTLTHYNSVSLLCSSLYMCLDSKGISADVVFELACDVLLCLQIDQLCPQHTFNMVSDVYIQNKLMSPQACRKLLLQLGVSDFISVPKLPVTVTDANKALVPWSDLDMQLGCSYTDYDGTEFIAIVESVMQTASPAECSSHLQLLVQTLDRRWEAEYKHCLKAKYTTPSGELH